MKNYLIYFKYCYNSYNKLLKKKNGRKNLIFIKNSFYLSILANK